MKKFLMTYILNGSILFVILFCLSSCESHQFDFDEGRDLEGHDEYRPTANNPIFENDWTVQLPGTEYFTGEGSLYKNWYIQSSTRPHNVQDPITSIPLKINAYNQDSGALDWSLQSSGEVQGGSEVCLIMDNVYLAMSYGGIVAFDLDSRVVLWEWSFRSPIWIDRGYQFVPFDGMVYVVLDYLDTPNQDCGSGSSNEDWRLVKIDPVSGVRTELYKVENASMSPPVFYTEPSRQSATILLNVIPQYYGQPENGLQHVHAIDANDGTLLWQIENCSENFPASVYFPPVVYEDVLITAGDWSLYGFDLNNKEELWRIPFDYSPTIWTRTSHLIIQDRLYVMPGGGDVSCIDPMIGEVIWNNPNAGMWCSEDILYLDDMLIYGNNVEKGIMALNAYNGGLIHFEPGYTNNNVLYNPNNEMYFTYRHQKVVGLNRK